MITSRKLEDLLPHVEVKARQFLADCKAQGIDVLIYCTYRDYEAQNVLYAQGRTAPGKRVTNAKAGRSLHNFRVAFDFVPILHGKPQWDDERLYAKCGAIGEKLGFAWAGRWTGDLQETAHMQFTGGRTLEEIKKEYEATKR